MNTSSISVPLSALSAEFVRNLQEKYPNAQVTITPYAPQILQKMQDDTFWSIIEQFDWGRKHPQDVLAPAVLALSVYDVTDIFAFDDCLANKLHTLDTERHAEPVGWNHNERFSPDGFLYARCAVVANGKDFYEKVLEAPTFMPNDSSFEPILYLAEKAYQFKTGKDDYDYLPETTYETFGNVEGWPTGPNMEKMLHH
jgi:Protein of unknown function (DUF4240)